MKTIEIKVYEFDELSEQAKQKAINILRERCVQQACNQDWADARDSIRKFEEIAHVMTDIEYSSQGFYCRWCRNTRPDYDLTDFQEFKQFKKDFFEQFENVSWSDDTLFDVVHNYFYEDDRSYEYNISNILLKYCKDIEQSTLCYYDADWVTSWIKENEYEFFEDGRPIIEELL